MELRIRYTGLDSIEFLAIRTRREGRLVYCSLDRESIRHRLSELEDLLRLRETSPNLALHNHKAAIAVRGER